MMDETIRDRNTLLSQLGTTGPLPGSVPYDNDRPINVPARHSGQTLFQCVRALHPHVSSQQWRDWFDQGHILLDAAPVSMDRVVKGGEQYQHRFPETIEPDVNAKITILWEDESLVAVNKPAPLPVHPSGRFNRNTLIRLIRYAYGEQDLRVVHRLDANTTGLLLLARSRGSATALSRQFDANQVSKRYLARCHGRPDGDAFTCREPIRRHPDAAGLRCVDPSGRSAVTQFRVLSEEVNGTCLLEARPLTGRTNQIRVHLWSLGYPIVGDPAYLPDGQLAAQQTLRVDQPPMCLHAASLSLKHPATGEPLELEAPSPEWANEQSGPASDG